MRYLISGAVTAAILLLTGCSTSNSLNQGGQSVRFSQQKPSAQCQLLGQVTGEQSNWFSGNNEGGSRQGAANDLRNKAAAMGGNLLYNVNSPSESFWSGFAPLATEITADVYKCPE